MSWCCGFFNLPVAGSRRRATGNYTRPEQGTIRRFRSGSGKEQVGENRARDRARPGCNASPAAERDRPAGWLLRLEGHERRERSGRHSYRAEDVQDRRKAGFTDIHIMPSSFLAPRVRRRLGHDGRQPGFGDANHGTERRQHRYPRWRQRTVGDQNDGRLAIRGAWRLPVKAATDGADGGSRGSPAYVPPAGRPAYPSRRSLA